MSAQCKVILEANKQNVYVCIGTFEHPLTDKQKHMIVLFTRSPHALVPSNIAQTNTGFHLLVTVFYASRRRGSTCMKYAVSFYWHAWRIIVVGAAIPTRSTVGVDLLNHSSCE